MKIHLSIDYIINKVHHSIHSKIKKITKIDNFTIQVIPVTKTNMVYELKSLRRKIVTVSIGGINTISRALVTKEANSNNHVIFA